MSDQILNDPRAGWAMALCSGDCNRAWLLSDLWFLDGEIICDDCLHDADGPDDRLARAQPFIGPDKNRIAELEAENARLKLLAQSAVDYYAVNSQHPSEAHDILREALNPTSVHSTQEAAIAHGKALAWVSDE